MWLASEDWDKLKWKMTWDDAAEPQVQVPFDRMYNSWRSGNVPLTAYQLGASEDAGRVTAYNFYPMPFLTEATVKIVSTATTTIQVTGTLLYKKNAATQD